MSIRAAVAAFFGVAPWAMAVGVAGSNAAPREVLAFYYPWYGAVGENGDGRHWQRANPARHDIADARHYPAQGPYDCSDPSVIARHIQQARTNGITGFIASWWGQGSYEDHVLSSSLLRAAAASDFKVSVYWENVPGQGQAQAERAVSDLVYLVSRYGTNRAFLKVNGKPVIFVYGRVLGQVPINSLALIIHDARAEGGDFLAIADGYREDFAKICDGLHEYNPCGAVAGKNPSDLQAWAAGHYREAVALARGHHVISCVTVIPGYDDTKIRKPGINAARLDGQVYRILWDEAIKSSPDWILITSWNEWHEGSEIEPSFELGDKYLKLTGESAARFREP